MAITSLFPTVIFFLSFIFIPPYQLHHIEASSDGFAVRLIHRDSPLSPLYDHRMTTLDRAISAVNRSISRLNYIQSTLNLPSLVSDISSRLVPEHGEYLMMYNLGTPPTQVYAIADTGSELTWLQCLPCKNCYEQTHPIFDPSKSSTYNKLSCDSQKCNSINLARCAEDDHEPCYYDQEYADGSTTKGTISNDTFAFEDPTRNSVEVGYLYFGCADESSGTFRGKQFGIVGLNQNPLSLISQLGIKKFSYCMVVPDDQGSGSRMYFGSRAVISGGQTPFAKWNTMHYNVTLEGISIGEEKVPIPEGTIDITERGFIIDSGTTFTMLQSEAYYALVRALTKAINLPQRKSPSKPFNLCFAGSFEDLDLQPDVTFHFENADVMLTKQTTYIELISGVWCLAMLPSSDNLSVLGNVQQQNYWVGYDLDSQMVSFAPVDCATF